MNKYQMFVSLAAMFVLTCGIVAASPSHAAHLQLKPSVSIAASIWSNIGPNNVIAASAVDNGPGAITGRVNSVAIDLSNPSTLFAGSAGGGVWKSTDNGATWNPISDVSPWTASTVNVVAINPANDLEIWAGTGDLIGHRTNPQLVGSGIMRSTDGGVTWNIIGAAQFGNLQVTAILFDPETPTTVTVATAGGTAANPSEIWQSTNDGATFKPVVGASADWQSLTASISNNGARTYYAVGAATQTGNALVYTSATRGATWTLATSPSAKANQLGLEIAASQVSANTVYVASAVDKDIYMSTDGATTWTSISNNGGVDSAGGPTIVLGVEATQIGTAAAVDAIYSGKHALNVSVDGGTTWTDLSQDGTTSANMSVGPLTMAFFQNIPNTSLVATDQGVYQLTYAAGSTSPIASSVFSSLNSTLIVGQVNKAAFEPLVAQSAIASFPSDSIGAPGSAAFASFGLGSWLGIPGGGDCAINANNAQEQYTSANSSQQATVFQTEDAWQDNVAIPLPTVPGDNVPAVPVLALDSSNDILYLGTSYLNSLNGATDTWTNQVGNTQLTAASDTITAIAIAPTNHNVIYTGSQLGQVWMTTNQGATWARIDTGKVSLPAGTAITSIAVNFDPSNPSAANDILVTDGNATLGHVFQCANTSATGGVSWVDLSANLPAASYYTVARDIDNPGSTFYVGCDFGVYYSVNSGATWGNGTRPLGLPIVPVTDLQAVTATRCLNAATLGRGVWQIAFPAPTPSIATVTPGSTAVGAVNVSINVQGTGFFTSSTVLFNSTPLNTTYESATDISATIPTSLLTAAGSNTITVVNPSPGNSSNGFTFIVTNPIPVITSLKPSSVVVNSAGFTLSVNGTGFYSGSTIQWNGGNLQTTAVSSTLLTTVIPSSDLTQLGTVQVTVLNQGVPPSNAVLFTVGYPNPVLKTLSPSSVGAGSPDLNLVLTGTGFLAGSTVNWRSITSQTTTQLFPTLNGTQLDVTVSAALLASGQVVSVTVTNPSPGGGTSQALTFIVSNATPTITQISPSLIGAGSSDLPLTVSGTNFAQGAQVTVNGTAYTPDPLTSTTTSLVVTIPAAAMVVGGYFPVIVTNPAPGGGASAPVTLEVDNPIPVASSITPDTAPAGSSSISITVTGDGFVQTSLLEWDGQPLATTFISGSTLTAVVPVTDLATGTAGAVSVVSPVPGGGTSAQLSFLVTNAVPTLSAVNPANATTGGPDLTITLTGTNFVPGSVVTWNTTTTLVSSFVSSTSLTATVPAALIANAGTGTIFVTNPQPGGGVTGNLQIQISNGLPTVTGLNPATVGIGSPAFTLTVSGSNFAPGATAQTGPTVEWTPAGSATATALVTTYLSGSQLSALVPANLLTTGGTATITVTNLSPGGVGGGTSTTSQTFTIKNPVPVLATLSPTTGLAGASNVLLTLGGSNFVQGSTVLVGSATLTPATVAENLITVLVPSLTASGQVNVSVVNPGPGGGTSSTLAFTVVAVHTYPAGLQMMSAPYDYSDSDFTSLLGLAPGKVAIFQPLLNQYALNPSYPADTFRLGSAYWTRLAQPEVLQTQGISAPKGLKYPIPILPTWNQIADPFPAPVDLSACSVTITGGLPVSFANASLPAYNIIYPTIYSYDAVNNVYVPHFVGNPVEPNPVLSPYIGYWLAAKSSCTLNVPPPTGF